MSMLKLTEKYCAKFDASTLAISKQEFHNYVRVNEEFIMKIKDEIKRNKALKDLEERLKSFNVDLENTEKKVKLKPLGKFTCEGCKSSNVVFDAEQSSVICHDCALTIYKANCSLVGNDDEISYATYTYKRINHFLEWITPFESSEIQYIPPNILQDIRSKLNGRSIDDIKRVLKRKEFKDFKELYVDIFCVLHKREKPMLSSTDRHVLEKMFNDIQIPFTEVCPKNRKNFLSYPYVVYKLLQLLNLNEFIPFISLLKSKNKIMVQENIFRDICKKLNWNFLPI